jgi:hypothetical protein
VDLTPEQRDGLASKSCKSWAAAGEALPAALQLVVDVSSSMSEDAPGTRLTKWEATRDALKKAITGDGTAQYPGLAASIPVGVLYYPNVNGGSRISTSPADLQNCVNTSAMIPIAPLGDAAGAQRGRITASLDQVALSTGTPTNDAYSYALEASMIPFQFTGGRFMLLITDGTPTLSKGCWNASGRLNGVDPQPIVDAVRAANDQNGIRTFVIGSPGSEDARDSLSAAARVGGTPASTNCSDSGNPQYCHMDMTAAPDFSVALRDGLAVVVGQLKSCTYEFPSAPPGFRLDPALINVIVSSSSGTTKLVLADDTPDDCTEGFKLTADQRVVLCPSTCNAVTADIKGSIELLFGCNSTEITR